MSVFADSPVWLPWASSTMTAKRRPAMWSGAGVKSRQRVGVWQARRDAQYTVPNPAPDRDYRIDLSCPEFTCLCPRSGFPDFATMYVAYVPGRTIVELKHLDAHLPSWLAGYGGACAGYSKFAQAMRCVHGVGEACAAVG